MNEQARLHPHFSIRDLERVRLVAGHPVKNPPYASFLRWVGFSIPTTALAEAITLDFLIASPQPLAFTTLVHEMVHCVQYRVLGIHRFSFDYVQGFCAFGYEGIPLERNAVDLSRRFLVGETFDVEEELRRNIGHL